MVWPTLHLRLGLKNNYYHCNTVQNGHTFICDKYKQTQVSQNFKTLNIFHDNTCELLCELLCALSTALLGSIGVLIVPFKSKPMSYDVGVVPEIILGVFGWAAGNFLSLGWARGRLKVVKGGFYISFILSWWCKYVRGWGAFGERFCPGGGWIWEKIAAPPPALWG